MIYSSCCLANLFLLTALTPFLFELGAAYNTNGAIEPATPEPCEWAVPATLAGIAIMTGEMIVDLPGTTIAFLIGLITFLCDAKAPVLGEAKLAGAAMAPDEKIEAMRMIDGMNASMLLIKFVGLVKGKSLKLKVKKD